MELQFDIKLSKSQQEVYDLVHDNKYKYYTVVFSRQSGKSILMMVLCIEWLFKQNNSIAYVCRNFTLAKKLYKELVKLIPSNVIKSSNGSDFFIETIYGSTLTFYSSEQGSSLRGQTFTHMICDEFAFHKQEQTDGTHLWNDILSPTLKSRGKKCIFVSTPLGRNNILYDMYLRGISNEFPQYVSILKTVYDDGFATPEQIEEIRKSIPDISFRQEYMCEWLDDGLTFFQGFAEVFDFEKPNGNVKCWCGCDLSSNGEDATILTSINELGEVEQYKIDGTLDMKYRQIAELINKINPVATYMENNGIGAPMINEVKKLVNFKNKIYEWTTTNSSKEEIVSDMAVKIANKEIHFNKNNKDLFAELGVFVVTVSKNRKLTFAAKNGKHDDRVLSACIALRCKEDFKYIGKNNLGFVHPQQKVFF